jgi:BetI-type transcriptional repressor, C-terminal
MHLRVIGTVSRSSASIETLPLQRGSNRSQIESTSGAMSVRTTRPVIPLCQGTVNSRLDDPVDQLRLAIHLGAPTGPDDEESRLLYELDALTGTSQAFATLSASFFDRHAMLYGGVLERGVESRVFELGSDPLTVARGLVALEDGLGLQVVLGHSGIDAAAGEAVLVAWASAATGVDLRSVDCTPA